jgi:hypothetical protein
MLSRHALLSRQVLLAGQVLPRALLARLALTRQALA